MLTKNTIKRIASLRVAKYRVQTNTFVAEGSRLIDDILSSNLAVAELYHNPHWSHPSMGKAQFSQEVSEAEMKKISSLSAPPPVLAVVEIPRHQFNSAMLTSSTTLALDTVQDPGNLGTIIRLADWFGIDNLLCSSTTADAYSPKVVQASMGAIARVNVLYCDLAQQLGELKELMPIYGAFMSGESIYTTSFAPNCIVVVGNEGNGISPAVEKLITKRIHIPSFAANRTSVESLNVAMAAAIICSEMAGRKARQ